MRLPLSLSFYKLISRTADKKKGAQYSLLRPGLLTPGTKYYWRVRAMDKVGVWGPWSKTWSFTARGPAYPLDVTLDYDQATKVGTLRWKPNPVGRKAAKYRVYGSIERGFTASDKRYVSFIGTSKKEKEEMAAWNPRFPANFIAETAKTELAVLGTGVDQPAANKTYYRVVAVDDKDKRSGPSDYATAPRPVIYSSPNTAAQVGQEYQYQVQANRSIGDMTYRIVGRLWSYGYFDIEYPKYALTKGPQWLKIDEKTGMLSGTPDAPGKTEVEVTVVIDRVVRKLDEEALKSGKEVILGSETVRLGPASQKFVIDVQ